jgi:hypothetical protein
VRLTGFVIAMHKKIRRLPSGKQRKEYIQFVEKVCFFKKCLFSIPIPFRTLCWLCFVQSLVCPYFGVLAENPNPFPSVKGSVCLVGSASCRAFGHTRPASVPGLNVGLPPSPSKDALAVSRTQSLHDAATPTTDNPHWGYAPNPIFRVM